MKVMMFVMSILFAAGAVSTHASAEDYPWCAYYGTGDGDAVNCGFSTREQCMATVSGVGGHCELNNQYKQPPATRSDDPAATRPPDHR